MIYGTQEFAQLLKELIKDEKRHPLYEITVKHAEEMSVHINGDKPLYLLERNRPREDEEVKAYRIENYEPTTKAGADRAITIVSKGFNPTLYSIVWPESGNDSKELAEYTLEYYPIYNSIIDFNKDVVLTKMLADANGLIAVKPNDIPDDTKKIEPVTVVYGSSAIWWYDRDCFLICVSEPDRYDKDQVYEFEYYDKNKYTNFTAEYDESVKQVIQTEVIDYDHKAGGIPAWFLGGKSKGLDNGKVVYKSFFSPALPYWNLAVKHGSDLMASIVGHIFPQKYEVAEECAYKLEHAGMFYGCRGGQIKYPGGHNGSTIDIQCEQCFGTGLVSVKGPLQTYQFLKEKLMEGTGLNLPPVGYIDVPIDATKFLDEYTDKMNQKAMAAINMDIEDKLGENQSGVAKVIDKSAQTDTIFDIISRAFMHIDNQFYFINKYKNGPIASATGRDDSSNLPDVHKPTKFELLTTGELINNFKVSKDSGLDRNILRAQATAIIESENGTAPERKAYLISMIDLDPLYGFTIEEINLGVSKGVVRKVDWAIHDNIKNFIDRAMDEDKKFLEKKRQEKIVVLEKFGNELIEAEKPRVDESIMITSFDDQQNAA